MTKIIIHGAGGAMGRVVENLAIQDEEVEIVAEIDINDIESKYPVYKSVKECDLETDVVIDFSNAQAIDKLIDDCVEKKLPIVLCTTGLSENTLNKIREAQKSIPILKSANMSVGVNMLFSVLKDVSNTLVSAGYDAEIVEKHHRKKLDAPSGTAISLADAINDGLSEKLEYTYDRSQERKMRSQNEIGISAVRGGTIVGEHEVIFAGEDEVITFKHTAYSKNIFGKGAIEGAKYLKGKGPGHYDMEDVISTSK